VVVVVVVVLVNKFLRLNNNIPPIGSWKGLGEESRFTIKARRNEEIQDKKRILWGHGGR
jgi:hypothetical protein